MKAGQKKKRSEYIDLEKNNARVQMMNFHLGEYYFRQEKFADAVQQYEQTNIANLSNREIADMKFHQGYPISPCSVLHRPNLYSTASAP